MVWLKMFLYQSLFLSQVTKKTEWQHLNAHRNIVLTGTSIMLHQHLWRGWVCFRHAPPCLYGGSVHIHDLICWCASRVSSSPPLIILWASASFTYLPILKITSSRHPFSSSSSSSSSVFTSHENHHCAAESRKTQSPRTYLFFVCLGPLIHSVVTPCADCTRVHTQLN